MIALDDPGPLPSDGAAPDQAAARPRAAGGARRGRRKADPLPGLAQAELRELVQSTLDAGTTIMALALASPDMALVRELCMTPEESAAIADPAARLLSHSKLVKKYSKAFVNGSDWVALAVATAMYSLRIAPLVAQKVQASKPHAAAQSVTPAPGYGPASAGGQPQPQPNGASPNGAGIPAHLAA